MAQVGNPHREKFTYPQAETQDAVTEAQYRQILKSKQDEALNTIKNHGINRNNLKTKGINPELFNREVNNLVLQWVGDFPVMGIEADNRFNNRIKELCHNNGQKFKDLKTEQELMQLNLIEYKNAQYPWLKEGGNHTKESLYLLARINRWITNGMNEDDAKRRIDALCQDEGKILSILSADNYDRLSAEDRGVLHNRINSLKDQELKRYFNSIVGDNNNARSDIDADFLHNLHAYNKQSNSFKVIASECFYRFLGLDVDLTKKDANIGSEVMKAMMKRFMPGGGKGDEKNISLSTQEGDTKKALDIPAVTLLAPTSINPLSLIMFFTMHAAAPAFIPVLAPFMFVVAVGFKFNSLFAGKKIWIFSCESPFIPDIKANNSHNVGGVIESKFLYVMIVDSKRNMMSCGKILDDPASREQFNRIAGELDKNKSYLEQLSEQYPDGGFMALNLETNEVLQQQGQYQLSDPSSINSPNTTPSCTPTKNSDQAIARK